MQTEKIDSYITQQMQTRRIPGLALGVVEHGKLVVKKAYGIANLETDTPVKTNSIFEIASVTKPFTAAAVMMLVQEGKVALDDPIRTYISDAPEAWKRITVRHLLTHTGGITMGGIVRLDDQGKLTTTFPPGGTALMSISTRRAFDTIAKAPLDFPAAESASYSDAGYFLLGMVIEKASGQSYREFMQKRIFDPLQMTDSSIIDISRIIKNHVSVYGIREGTLSHWRGGGRLQHELPSFYGMLSTVEDLAKWDVALTNGTLLKKSSLEQMWTPAKLANGQDALVAGELYGLGWALGEFRGHRIAAAGGATGTQLLHFLDTGLTIIVLTNLDASASLPALLAFGVAGLLKPEYQPPQMLTPQPDPSPRTTQDIRTLLSDLAEGHASPTMTAAHRAYYENLPPLLRQARARLLKTLTSLTYLASDDVEGRGLRISEPIARISYYKGELGQKAFYFTFGITKEGKVAHLRYYPE